MNLTVYGQVLTRDGLGMQQTGFNAARVWDPIEWRASGLPTDGVLAQQPAVIPVGFDHPAALYRVGEVVHLEKRPDESLWALAELEDPYVDPHAQTFFSIEARARKRDGRNATIEGVVLCGRSATLGLHPVTFRRGDLADRGNWTTNLDEKELIARAVEARHRRRGGPIRVHTPTPLPRHPLQLAQGFWIGDDGEPIPSAFPLSHRHRDLDDDPSRPYPGRPLEHRPCRIISVR